MRPPGAGTLPSSGSHHERLGPLPADIAFLLRSGVSGDILRTAARLARLRGTSAREELLSAGYNQGSYWSALARDLGLVFSATLRARELDAEQHIDDADLAREPIRLAVRRGSVHLLVLAPGPQQISALRRALARAPALAQRILIASPETMQALILRERRETYVAGAVHRLARRFPRLSAVRLADSRSRGPLALSAAALAIAALYPAQSLYAASWILALIFLNCVAWKGAAAFHRPRPPHCEAVPSRLLPTYSVLVPLYREAPVLGDLLRHLGALDYPASKLQVLLVLEEDDAETRAAVAAETLPHGFSIVVVPKREPRTKPKALAFALTFATGDYVVVFDAEDRPEADQLRKAAAAFRDSPRLGCLQARLTPDNTGHLLARFFALEYASIFEVLLPALASWRVPLPLGGTSNHFPRKVLDEIGGWDPFNVTEDADIGIRLARFGWRSGMLNSRTYEEAPVSFSQWLPQRRRWIKGWMQTACIAIPGRAPRHLGLSPLEALAVHAVITGGVIGLLLYPLSILGVVYAYGPWMDGRFPATPVDWALIAVNGCNLAGVLLAAAVSSLRGVRRTGALRLAWLIPLLPAYWALLSFAAWQAAWQFIRDPSKWEKTLHGVAKDRRTPGGAIAG